MSAPAQAKTVCMSEVPDPWTDNQGRQTNICKDCGGVLLLSLDAAREIGSLITALQGAIERTVPDDHHERGELAALLRSKVDEWVRHSYLMRRHNVERAVREGTILPKISVPSSRR